MPIRLFYYMAEIWRKYLKEHSKEQVKKVEFKLPAIDLSYFIMAAILGLLLFPLKTKLKKLNSLRTTSLTLTIS